MSIRILEGDVRERLAELPSDSFDCIVTSPPYWGLRDYGTAKWEGGSEDCDHIQQKREAVIGSSSTLGFPAGGGSRKIADGNTYHEAFTQQFRSVCSKCGARRIDNQIGLEPTLTEYLVSMVTVCRELRRVLKPSGTFWLNVGDSYAANGISGLADGTLPGVDRNIKEHSRQRKTVPDGLKPKDLCLVPNRLAIRLQEDGWWVRSEIIWAKPNPMPESVTDRPTSSHEKIWLLTKSERYAYDADAIREAQSEETLARYAYGFNKVGKGISDNGASHSKGNGADGGGITANAMGRNARNVWTIATQPYPEAHFATFPPELAERCIKAGCPTGGHVLDPFGGAGTTGLVADRLGRDATLIELNPSYVSLIKNRIAQDAGMFAQVAAE